MLRLSLLLLLSLSMDMVDTDMDMAMLDTDMEAMDIVLDMERGLLRLLLDTTDTVDTDIMDITDTMAMDMDMARGQLRPPWIPRTSWISRTPRTPWPWIWIWIPWLGRRDTRQGFLYVRDQEFSESTFEVDSL